MNDDVSNRTFNLAVSTTKLSARTLLKAVIKINNKWTELQKQPKKGKQSVNDLLSHNQGLTSVDVAETDLKGFKKVDHLTISCVPENIASERNLQYAGGEFVEILDVPEWHNMYEEGKKKVKVYYYGL